MLVMKMKEGVEVLFYFQVLLGRKEFSRYPSVEKE